jgi:hypothetical protein
LCDISLICHLININKNESECVTAFATCFEVQFIKTLSDVEVASFSYEI